MLENLCYPQNRYIWKAEAKKKVASNECWSVSSKSVGDHFWSSHIETSAMLSIGWILCPFAVFLLL